MAVRLDFAVCPVHLIRNPGSVVISRPGPVTRRYGRTHRVSCLRLAENPVPGLCPERNTTVLKASIRHHDVMTCRNDIAGSAGPGSTRRITRP